MPFSDSSPALLAPNLAVLLVLLPIASPDGPPHPRPSRAALDDLQRCLGPAIRVLRIDEASHPAVVRSFAPAQLPACVLVRQGIELWRQPGLPESAALVAQLLEVAHTW